MSNKIGLYLIGFIFIIEGLLSLKGFKILFKYTGGWKHVTNEYSIFLIIMGLIFVYFAITSQKSNKQYKYTPISICPQCKKKYYNKDIAVWLCPKCNISVVDIDKYYKKINKQKSKTKLDLKPNNQTKPNPNKKIDMSKINIKDIKIDSLKRTNK